MDAAILWSPKSSEISETALWRFARQAGLDPRSYDDLHRWSTSQPGAFWSQVWDFAGVVGDKGDRDFVPDETAWMTGARFFPEARLNIAENLLKGNPEETVVFASDEAGNLSEVTRGELRALTLGVAGGLRRVGVVPGDRVAGIQPNNLDALVALLASISIGAIWTACSPDFGATAITDRIGQVEPKVLFATPQYTYGGKDHDISPKIAECIRQIPSIRHLVLSGSRASIDLPDAISVSNQDEFVDDTHHSFARLPFDHPAYILFTSGTTGIPKAIVHRTGGVLLQHLKEHLLHGDVRPGDRLIWYTNTAWMMYHWMVSALAAGSAIVLYDGAPILKVRDELDPSPLWDVVEKTGVTHLGVSPKYVATLASEHYLPGARHNLSSLRVLLACGAPMLPHQFDWIYESIKQDMMFASISGGTEILGSFLIGSPMHPVRRGQLTVPALGHAVGVLDERGISVIGRRGELVCTEPFPSMPLTFWGEDGDARYHKTYFSDHAEVWTHGDVAELTATGGGVVHGRSDNTMNPGGVRIGSSEIYAACQAFDAIDDSIVFGAMHNGDEEVVLCIKPSHAATISPDLVADLRKKIRSDASPRHVPRRVHVVHDIPYTASGKRVEGAARTAASGGAVINLGSLVNPACLEEYKYLRREDAM